MKVKNIYYALFPLAILLMTACAGQFKTYDLSEDYMTSLHYEGSSGASGSEEDVDERKGVPAIKYYNGDLLGGAIWWARKGIKLDKEDDFIVIADSIGPESTPFGSTFPPLDFTTEKIMLKVTARAEGKDGAVPSLHLQLVDANGYKTNASRPSQEIKNTDDVEDYYFDLNEIYVQSTPEKHQVNGGFINSLEFLINPGGTPFTGKIIIEEMKVVPASAVE